MKEKRRKLLSVLTAAAVILSCAALPDTGTALTGFSVTASAESGIMSFTADALAHVTEISVDNEPAELSAAVALQSGYYYIISSYPLSFEGAEPDEETSAVNAGSAEYEYGFELDEDSELSVSLADLPSISIDSQLVTGNKLQGFKRFGESVDYNTYDDLPDGDYHMFSKAPLTFTGLTLSVSTTVSI